MVALEALGGLREHKGLIHGLCSVTARFFGRSSSTNIPFVLPSVRRIQGEMKERFSSIVSSLMLLILQTEERLVLESEPKLRDCHLEKNKC